MDQRPIPPMPRQRILDRVLVEAGSPSSAGVYGQLLWAGAFLALGIHLVYALVFWFLGVSLLTASNAVLALADLGSMVLLRAGWRKTVEISAQVLILANSSLNILWLGWDGGFHYFILQLLPLVLLGFERPLAYKAGFAALILGLLVVLFLLTRAGPGPAGLPGPVLDRFYLANLAFVLVIMAVQAATFARGVAAIALQLRDSNEKLNTIAYFDPLTGLLNRRALWDRLRTEEARARRHPPPPGFVVALADIDDFKAFNDRWGHDLGDRVLAHVARVLKENLRATDVAARWGGEEFLVVLTEVEAGPAAATLERLRAAVERGSVDHGGVCHTVTITLGASPWRSDEAAEATISRADGGLLEGKRQGKNRVVFR